ncbi:MAG: sporulation initiation factor Spo0A C-terminal domain-containing protein [Treponema sp.]|nr:sporulation initiation factor Spo0A C-terminal domain-containing protein [Treponema sp.]
MYIKAKLRITNKKNTEQLLRIFLMDLNTKSTLVIKDGMIELKYFFSEEIYEDLLEIIAQHEVMEMSYEVNVENFGKSSNLINPKKIARITASNNAERIISKNSEREIFDSEQSENVIGNNYDVNCDSLSLEKYITKIIQEIGISAGILGYSFLRKAVHLVINDQNILNAYVKSLLPAVAKEFNTTPKRVERAIRHAIDTAWRKDMNAVNSALFGKSVTSNKEKPTSKMVIACLADRIKLELNLR